MRRAPADAATEGVEDQVDPIERALQLAYRYLNRRERTAREVRRHLNAKAIDPDVVDRALGSLQDQGVLDDARFARVFAEDKQALEQWGSERIRSSLLARGIDREIVDQALASRSHESELDQALDVLRRRFPQPPRERRDRDRALGVLVRKGYDPDLALDALTAFARHHRSFDPV